MTSQFEDKLTILLALESIGSVTQNELNNILSDTGIINYFDLSFALDALVDENSVLYVDNYFSITEKGKEELDLFIAKIPNSIKNNLLLNAPDIINKIHQSREVVVLFSKIDGNSVVDIQMYVDSLLFFKAKFSSQNEFRRNILELAQKNREEIYNILLELCKPGQTVEDIIDHASIQISMKQDFCYLNTAYHFEDEIWEFCLLIPIKNNVDLFVYNWTVQYKKIIKKIKKLLLGDENIQ